MSGCGTGIGVIPDGLTAYKCGDGFRPVTLTGGLGLTYDPATKIYTLTSTNIPITWVTVTSTSQQIAVQTGYINSSPTLCSYALPTTATVGQEFMIDGRGPGGWKITQAAGQSIEFGTIATTVGTTGSLQSNLPSDHVKLRCVVANTTWKVEVSTDLMWS